MKPVIYSDNFMWNLNSSVGKGGQNITGEDVAYIQFYYICAATNPKTAPDRRAIYSRVSPTGACTGQDSDPLVQSIMAHQRFLSHPSVDGRVSVATGSGHIGDKAFFVYRIGARLADMFPRAWPRVDLIPGCPTAVKTAVERALPKI